MAVLKVIEVLSNSSKSWEDATEKAIVRTGKKVKNIKSAYVQDQSVVVKNSKVKEYRISLKVTFEVVD